MPTITTVYSANKPAQVEIATNTNGVNEIHLRSNIRQESQESEDGDVILQWVADEVAYIDTSGFDEQFYIDNFVNEWNAHLEDDTSIEEKVDTLDSVVSTILGENPTEASATKLMNVIAISFSSTVTSDQDAIENSLYIKEWNGNSVSYAIGEYVKYNGIVYRVVQAHTSQATWTPDTVPALFTKATVDGSIPEWEQPTGAQDAYELGAVVMYNGHKYQSTVNNNVWKPDEYGWELID